ncbi:MAG TPA: hypothetical protein VF092_01240 [Longimicrobium sp.]
MRLDMGLFDRLFGKKATIELPLPDGGVRRVRVSVRWLREMERQGKISPVNSKKAVKVHILDPQAGLGAALGLSETDAADLGITVAADSYRIEEWVVGEHISAEQYSSFREAGTGDLFVFITYRDGQRSTHVVRPEVWKAARETMH